MKKEHSEGREKQEAKKEIEAESEEKKQTKERIEEKEVEEIEPFIEEEREVKLTEEEEEVKRGKERGEREREDRIGKWTPKTKLGMLVKERKIKTMDEVLAMGIKMMEQEIVDTLLRLEIDLIAIGQAKGKFGGGKKRAWKQTQKKTAEGNVPTFACMAVVGNKEGYVGIGYGKAKETLPAREKALRNAKINITKVERGCGSFDCGCNEKHSIKYKTEGKCAGSRIILFPAPKGTGLVIEDECKKILRLAGIKDIYSKTFGQTRTKMNLAKACFEALKKIKIFV